MSQQAAPTEEASNDSLNIESSSDEFNVLGALITLQSLSGADHTPIFELETLAEHLDLSTRRVLSALCELRDKGLIAHPKNNDTPQGDEAGLAFAVSSKNIALYLSHKDRSA